MDIKKKRESFIKWFFFITLLGSLLIMFPYFKQGLPLPVAMLFFAGILAAKLTFTLVPDFSFFIAFSFFGAHAGFYFLIAWVIAGYVYPYPMESVTPPAETKSHDADSNNFNSRN